MSDEWSDNVKTAVATFILVLLVHIVIAMIYIFSNQIDKNSKTFNNSVETLSQMEIKKFDHKKINGSEVINTIENYKELCIIVKYPCDASVCMAFNHGITDSHWNSNGIYDSEAVPNIAALKDIYSTLVVSNKADSDSYINPSANFDSTLLKDENGVVIGLVFSHIQ